MVTTPTLNIFLSFRRGDGTVISTRIKDRLTGYYKGGYQVSDDVGYIPLPRPIQQRTFVTG